MGWFASWGALGLFAEYFLKSALVLILALIAAAAARRGSAAFRHFVLSFALIGLLLLPLLSLGPLGWETALLPDRLAAGHSILASVPASSGETPDTRAKPVVGGSEAQSVLKAAKAFSLNEDSPAPAIASTLKAVPVLISSRSRGILGAVVALIWSAGLVILILRLAFGLAAAARLTSEGLDLSDAGWRRLLERFLLFVPLKRPIRLKNHPKVLMPLTWGWKRPVVLMPPVADGWAEEERSSALFHELSHIKRADFMIMLLVRFGLAVFWFNPLCWIAYRELRKEQEIACDELVLRAGIRPSTYAASLLAFRRSAGFRWKPSAALLGMIGKGSFEERLAAILKQKLAFKEVKMKTKIMLATAAVLAVAAIGTARPALDVEKKPAAASPAAAAMPASEPAAVALPAAPAQETQAAQTEPAAKDNDNKEPGQDKSVDRTKILVKTKDGKGGPIEITITEGDVDKTLVLERPLTITKDKNGHVLIRSSDGKEILVLEGELIRLGIKAGDIEVIKERRARMVDESRGAYVVRKAIKAGHGHAVAITPADEGLLDKVREIREQVQMVKDHKLELAEVEKSLEKLETELKAQKDRIEYAEILRDKKTGDYVVAKKIVAVEPNLDLGVQIVGTDKPNAIWSLKTPAPGENGPIELMFDRIAGPEGREYYDRVLAGFKARLPADFGLESDFDEDSRTMRFKITPPEGWDDREGLIKKLVESLQEKDEKY